MESLNLNALAGSLPTSNLANAEKELLNNFRAAALSITNLYRSSRTTSKRSYNSGYAAACADLLQMIQQGVSDSETPLSIGRVMDWVEARLEAVRAREEEELEEDEENSSKKEGQASKLKASSTLARASSAPAVPQQQSPREQPGPLPPSKLSQSITAAPNPRPTTPPSPPTAATAPPYPVRGPKVQARAVSSPLQAKENPSVTATPTSAAHVHPFPLSPDSPFTFTAFPPLPSSPAPTEATLSIPIPLTVSAGAKRRHAMMVLTDDAASAPPGAAVVGTGIGVRADAGSSRRRTRSTRGAHQNQHPQDAMDTEEDGRERKRVARR
ncbi:hypothetical protein EDB89DRAFT_1986934 [Lactarius sanguifluus]|nr:hypothetical protein EDB89DRAFT_1986934 [Lactarius sanguifluus]